VARWKCIGGPADGFEVDVKPQNGDLLYFRDLNATYEPDLDCAYWEFTRKNGKAMEGSTVTVVSAS
jgi:hypothetical protein